MLYYEKYIPDLNIYIKAYTFTTSKSIKVILKNNIFKITSYKQLKEKYIIDLYNKYYDEVVKYLSNNTKSDLIKYIHFNGLKYEIKVVENKNISYSFDHDNKFIFFYLRQNTDANLKKYVKNMYLEQLDSFINIFFLDALKAFNAKLNTNFKPNLKVVYTKSFLGRCNIKTNLIEISAYLLKFNKEVIQYVIFHELSHLIYQDHQKKFHLLLQMFVNEKKINKYIRESMSIIKHDFY